MPARLTRSSVRRTVLLATGCALALLCASRGLAQTPSRRTVSAPPTGRAPSFLNEVVPLFTRLGCNQGACHGKGAGQNGFRLSLRGYAPETDHVSLTREFSGRRVDPARPDDSLILQKPSGRAPHEGGKL